jgi:hypothetical protein
LRAGLYLSGLAAGGVGKSAGFPLAPPEPRQCGCGEVHQRLALLTAARAAAGTTPTGSPARRAVHGLMPGAEVHAHHHWHGVNSEDIAAVIRRQQGCQPGG